MKNQPLSKRMRFALEGLRWASSSEASFRTQLVAAVLALLATAAVRPALVWWALIVAFIVLVLAAELLNTALEQVLDGLHPEHADFVRLAKDCAAGAVLLLSVGAAAVFVLMLIENFR